jgi:hypothetical protein
LFFSSNSHEEGGGMKIKIIEYFLKYGFKDGTNTDLLNLAYGLFPAVIEAVNLVLEKNMPKDIQAAKMVELDYDTVHNPCRAAIMWREKGVEWEWDSAGAISREGIRIPGHICWINKSIDEVQKDLDDGKIVFPAPLIVERKTNSRLSLGELLLKKQKSLRKGN